MERKQKQDQTPKEALTARYQKRLRAVLRALGTDCLTMDEIKARLAEGEVLHLVFGFKRTEPRLRGFIAKAGQRGDLLRTGQRWDEDRNHVLGTYAAPGYDGPHPSSRSPGREAITSFQRAVLRYQVSGSLQRQAEDKEAELDKYAKGVSDAVVRGINQRIRDKTIAGLAGLEVVVGALSEELTDWTKRLVRQPWGRRVVDLSLGREVWMDNQPERGARP